MLAPYSYGWALISIDTLSSRGSVGSVNIQTTFTNDSSPPGFELGTSECKASAVTTRVTRPWKLGYEEKKTQNNEGLLNL